MGRGIAFGGENRWMGLHEKGQALINIIGRIWYLLHILEKNKLKGVDIYILCVFFEKNLKSHGFGCVYVLCFATSRVWRLRQTKNSWSQKKTTVGSTGLLMNRVPFLDGLKWGFWRKKKNSFEMCPTWDHHFLGHRFFDQRNMARWLNQATPKGKWCFAPKNTNKALIKTSKKHQRNTKNHKNH